MLSWYHLVLAQQERHKERLREMERERIIRQALKRRESGESLHRRVLAWVGGWLVVWGQHLQQRYGATSAPTALQSANRAC